MGIVLRVLLVVAHLAGASFSCSTREVAAPAAERERSHGLNILHAHGDDPGRAGELRAPCACGCDERPLTTLGSGVLGVALLPAQVVAELPRASHLTPAAVGARPAPARLPDPVPRLA